MQDSAAEAVGLVKPVIECHEVTKTFLGKMGEISILRGVNLSVRQGEILLVSGRNGTGRLRCLTYVRFVG